jgi:hypothetical protein
MRKWVTSNGGYDREDAGYQVAVRGGNCKGRRQRPRSHASQMYS